MSSVTEIEVRDQFAEFLEQNLNKELLRFTTAGSVDDGKSTLIGRLLHDSKTVYEDQLASIKKSRVNRSSGPIDFSLITDGLRAEREQGITIDVGYRYFTTAQRKFIIADTPGHEQYTRNMATGASTADLAVILIDGTKGLLPQTLRHTYISSLLGIPTLVAAVNKMDLLGYKEEEFRKIEKDFLALAERLGVKAVTCIPISALAGDNVVARSRQMPWYGGPAVLEHLERVPIVRSANTSGVRFPVQYVLRPDANFRGFAGQLAGGAIRPGDAVTALPSGQTSRVDSIVTFDGSLAEAASPMSVTVTLENEIDLSRGDMLVSSSDVPKVSQRFLASIVWMHTQALEVGRSYLIKHCARQVRGKATAIRHRVNVNTLEPESAANLQMNDIAAVEVETSSALFFDAYEKNRTTGSFIIIDPLNNATLAAGMIRDDLSAGAPNSNGRKILRSRLPVMPLERHLRHGHFPAIILANSHVTLAQRLERALFEEGFEAIVIDGNAGYLPAKAAWNSLYSAGFVVIYLKSSLETQERVELRSAAKERFFDLAEAELPAEDADGIERVVAWAQSLRMPPQPERTEKVN
ncbi:MAG: sulfate adenylyltransferase subunit CysN [Acidobacteria bacterium]|nr:sulfate adenylyltransferase subunit CysN [Acidobacteriota bacterium]MBS1867293.1 sulfate adenylyltransferase subunit CysN [Acidobacteriota bacterium]